jgi:hypothetical protein
VYVVGDRDAPLSPFLLPNGIPIDGFAVKIHAVASCTEKPDTPLPFKPVNEAKVQDEVVKLNWSDTTRDCEKNIPHRYTDAGYFF